MTNFLSNLISQTRGKITVCYPLSKIPFELRYSFPQKFTVGVKHSLNRWYRKNAPAK